MKIKANMLRKLITTGAAWGCTTGYIHNQSLFVTKEGKWYRIMLPATLKDIDGSFDLSDLKTALGPGRGYVDIMTSSFSITVGIKTILIESGHTLLPPALREPERTSSEFTAIIPGITWASFITRTNKHDETALREEFRGILFDSTFKTLHLVSTNGLSLISYDTGINAEQLRVTLPRDICKLWQVGENFTVTFRDEYFIFAAEDEEITGKILPTIYPSYTFLLDKGTNIIEFQASDIEFIRKIAVPYIDVKVRNKYFQLEWYGGFEHNGQEAYDGTVKIPVTCPVRGKMAMTTESLIALLDYGPTITIFFTKLEAPMVVSLGGYTYVFIGSWATQLPDKEGEDNDG